MKCNLLLKPNYIDKEEPWKDKIKYIHQINN
jgi:hypothetical protein